MNTYNIDKMYENYSSEIERMQKCIDELQQENQTNKTIIEKQVKRIYELEHTIEELKKWLEEHYDYSDCLRIKFVLNKIKELEEGVK